MCVIHLRHLYASCLSSFSLILLFLYSQSPLALHFCIHSLLFHLHPLASPAAHPRLRLVHPPCPHPRPLKGLVTVAFPPRACGLLPAALHSLSPSMCHPPAPPGMFTLGIHSVRPMEANESEFSHRTCGPSLTLTPTSSALASHASF